MGRRQTIDRNAVLDGAEKVVKQAGVGGLTIDAVAKATGISKGGVQYCFGTKDDLIAAMLDRWEAEFDASVSALEEKDPSPRGSIAAHVEVTRRSDWASADRSAVMMAALLQNKERLRKTSAWYSERLNDIDPSTEEGRRLRLAFFATEGVFLLHSFGFMSVEDDQWEEIFKDIQTELVS
ncbi:TetR/AcrR family transcriptional regulator [Aquamicrobium sp. LC103]|uniref:TetR/AcrR family transcriptional regulator n=1 Tax=Aquamicrobium sp. LC103 TaxID=1120658 RepID=UPI00063E82E4|nr:TetR/AcrR family transcriptional regulator [Aquamicrobium sp. LC103]TKT69385.1 TetR/AcrR family transcriptional regulator [Aquamicrobium sp. LC103]